MSKKLLSAVAVLAGCLITVAQAQSSSGSSGSSSGYPAGSSSGAQGDTSSGGLSGSSSDSSKDIESSSSQTSSTQLSATGRSQHQILGSKLMETKVQTSQNQQLGTIEDVIINPMSGHIEFVVLSLDSSGAGSSTSTSTTTTTTTTTSSSEGNLVAVPWSLFRVQAAGSTSAQSMQYITFTGQSTKLQSAPKFSQSDASQLSQPQWRQSVYSHFGVQAPSGAMGGSSSTFDKSTGGSSTGGSSGSSYDSSSGASSSPGSSSSGSSSENPASDSSKSGSSSGSSNR